MTVAKKQFEFVIRGRVLALDTAGVKAIANLQTIIDAVVVEGIEYDLTTPSGLVGAAGQQFTYPTLVADYPDGSPTAALAATMAAAQALITTMKAIT